MSGTSATQITRVVGECLACHRMFRLSYKGKLPYHLPRETTDRRHDSRTGLTLKDPAVRNTTAWWDLYYPLKKNCYCCTCGHEGGHTIRWDPACRNHGAHGLRACKKHDLPDENCDCGCGFKVVDPEGQMSAGAWASVLRNNRTDAGSDR